jgi:hypothetical protein
VIDKNKQRREERARRRTLFEQLKLQGEILCESNSNPTRQSVVLNRMLNTILNLVKDRKVNDVVRQVLADHFTDCAHRSEGTVQLGGEGERNYIYLDGAFHIDELAKRIVWAGVRGAPILENEVQEK